VPAYRRALEMADRRVGVLDQTMRSMRDAVRLAGLYDDDRNIFVVNRVGEVSQALSLKDVQTVLQVQPTSLIPFLPKLVTPAATHALVAASKRGKFTDGIDKLAFGLSGRQQRRKRFWRRAK